MNVKEILVIMFEKEIGELKQESEIISENNIVYSLTFLHKKKQPLRYYFFKQT
jgi:hypothetical protein